MESDFKSNRTGAMNRKLTGSGVGNAVGRPPSDGIPPILNQIGQGLFIGNPKSGLKMKRGCPKRNWGSPVETNGCKCRWKRRRGEHRRIGTPSDGIRRLVLRNPQSGLKMKRGCPIRYWDSPVEVDRLRLIEHFGRFFAHADGPADGN